MAKLLTTDTKNSEVALSKTKNLLKFIKNILTKKNSNDLEDYSWIEKLWEWADKSNIKLPKDKNELLNLTKLDLGFNHLTELPAEIKNLTLTKLHIYADQNFDYSKFI